MYNGKTQLRHSDEPARERSPQTDQQEEGGPRRHHFQDGWRRRRRRRQPRVHEWNGRYGAEEHKAGSRQTAGKRREKSLHRPLLTLARSGRVHPPRKCLRDAPLSRGPTHYRSMIPRFRPIVTACVRSFAASLARMFLTWPLTVSSVMRSRSAIILLAFPSAMSLSTSISRSDRSSSAACSASVVATSGTIRLRPA